MMEQNDGMMEGVKRHVACLVLLVCAFGATGTQGRTLSPTRLTCEYLSNPIGIDAPQPRLSWQLDSDRRSEVQTAYQILVASSESELAQDHGDLLDTGKVSSDSTLHVPYEGKPLAAGLRCFWKVRAWDKNDKPSGWSQPAFWEMGLLSAEDWKGKWICRTADTNSNPAPLLRRAFAIDGKVKRARAYICGLGYYELHINGKKIGDHLLDPGYTRYDKRDLYVTYDVTDSLRKGKNAIGVILGNGWLNVHTLAVWDFHKAPWRAAPKLLMQLQVEFADGRVETIVTDTQWKTITGPIVFDSIYSGQTYDARLEKSGWDTPGYNDSGWSPALLVEGPKGKLAAQMMPPIRADQIIKPTKVTEPRPGIFVFDFGQNFAGFAELHSPKSAKSSPIVLRYSERLGKDGMIDRADIQQHVLKLDTNQAFQSDTYLLDSSHASRITHHIPRFSYHGFQYVELTGFRGKPPLDTLRGVFIHSAVPPAGEFECSNPLLNKVWRAARWSYLSNLQGIPTDCPHREKNGWTGDAHLAAEQGLLNFASAPVYTKWINDLADEQRPAGDLPGIVPTSGWGYKWGNGPAWDSAFELIPFYLYQYCNDTRILTEHYEGLKRYVDYLTTKAKDGIVSIGLNDWAPWETKTPAEITSTAYYFRDAQIVALAAKLCGKEEESQKYSDLADSIKAGFNQKFYHGDTGIYGSGSQTALSCALYQGLVDPASREIVLSNLVAAIEKRDGHLDTGILGAKYLLNALLENGRAEVAYRIITQTNQPGWGWWFSQGATTLWEQWNGSDSRNHIMFGDISAWFYKALAGINPDPAAPGFKHIIIKPQVAGNLTFARASYDSVRGRIVSDWKIERGTFHLTVTIPANTTATVYFPSLVADSAAVKEGNNPAASAEGVRLVSAKGAIFEVGSGTYKFRAPVR
jgi:alpha-L-rhamnosidase